MGREKGFHSSSTVSLYHLIMKRKWGVKGRRRALILLNFANFLSFAAPGLLACLKSKDLCARFDGLYFECNHDIC